MRLFTDAMMDMPETQKRASPVEPNKQRYSKRLISWVASHTREAWKFAHLTVSVELDLPTTTDYLFIENAGRISESVLNSTSAAL